MLVSYTYRSDDPEPGDEPQTPSSRSTQQKTQPVMKTFNFYTVVDLGTVIPREESRSDAMEI